MVRAIRPLLFGIVCLVACNYAHAATTFSWDDNINWEVRNPKYYRIAVAVEVNGQEVARVFDHPDGAPAPLHKVSCAVSSSGRPVVTAIAYLYNGGYWLPATDYQPYNRLAPLLNYPQILYRCLSAGTSAASMADWTPKQVNSGSVIDNGDGTVAISLPGHGWRVGDTINISGSAAYDGDHVLTPLTTTDSISFSAAYTAETFSTAIDFTPIIIDDPAMPQWAAITIDSGDITDTGQGTVLVPAPSHGWQEGDTIIIDGTANYDGSYILPVQTHGDVDHIEITATFVPETISSAVDLTPNILHDGTTVWQRFVDGGQWVPNREEHVGVQIRPLLSSPWVRFRTPTAPWHKYGVFGDVSDTGSGTVLIPVASHGFAAGQMIRIQGSTNYDGLYTLPPQTNGDADHLEIPATFVAETLHGIDIWSIAGISGSEEPDWSSVGQGGTISDGSIIWTRMEDTPYPAASLPSRRIRVVKQGQVMREQKLHISGKFLIRYAQ